jgi:hypothetical protein
MTTLLQIFDRRGALALVLAALIALPGAARAGDVLLTVTGAIASDKPATFDRDALSDLPRAQFTTSTVWTAGRIRFAGVRLRDLMDAVGAHGATLHAVGLNDYAIDLPMSDAAADGPIIAYEMNGKPMSVREKGPLWIVYPYDSDVRFRTEITYGRSVWQLVRIEVSD